MSIKGRGSGIQQIPLNIHSFKNGEGENTYVQRQKSKDKWSFENTAISSERDAWIDNRPSKNDLNSF